MDFKRRIRNKKIVFLFLFFAILGGIFIKGLYAKPVISSILGDAIDGHNITIRGVYFGEKQHAPPLIWLNFEGGVSGNSASGEHGFDEAGSRTTFSDEISNSGNISSRMDWVQGDEGFSSCRGTIYFPRTLGVGDKVYFHSKFYFRSPWSWTCSPRVKIMRIHIRGVDNSHKGYLSVLAGTTGNLILSNEVYIYEPTTGLKFSTDEWQSVEMLLNLSVNHPEFRIWRNGLIAMSDLEHKTLDEDTDNADFALLMSYWNGGAPQDQEEFIDDIYIDDTPARIELCNDSDWNESRTRHCEIQIPTSWNDTQITFTVNQGSFPNGSQVYLFVIDENETASEGYPLTIGKQDTEPVCEASSGHHCYYIAPWGNDSDEGSFERPFRTVQKGFDVISPGDYLYLREGIYREHIEIRPYNKPQGNPDNWYTVKSYPGEWAIINSSYDSPCPVIFYGSNSCGTHGSHGYDFCPQYWKFEHFEVTGGGIDDSVGGSGIRFDTAANIIFDHLYVHDNRGSSSGNNGGIVISNEAPGAASNITIQYSYFKDNACSDLHNCGDIVLFSDYKEDPNNVDINYALKNNVIRYNLIEGSAVGLKYKNSQWLSLDHSGKDLRYKNYGDRVYRNIFSGQGDSAILGRQDFIQIYENIFNFSKNIDIGEAYGGDREPFYACFYNNLLIGTTLSVSHDDDNTHDGSSYSAPDEQPDYHPHVYIYNNIFQDTGPESNGHNDINIFFTWSEDYQQFLNMSTVHIENDLFVPTTTEDEVIDIGDDENDYPITQYLAENYSYVLYNKETKSGLHVSGNPYKTDPYFRLNDTVMLYNGGIGGFHPYLEGVTLPSYIGPCPDSECSWVDDVLSLSNISNLKDRNFEVCGDNYCNTSDNENCSTCPQDCGSCSNSTQAVCSNGVIEEGEQCDDGNTITENCTYGQTSCIVCSSTCQNISGSTSYCGDGLCDALHENSTTCSLDCSSQQHQCTSGADTSHNGKIETSELINYINQWLQGNATIAQVVNVIKEWKGGC